MMVQKRIPLILGISGSPHRHGIVERLLAKVLAGAKRAGARAQTIRLYDLRFGWTPGYYSQDPRKEVVAMMPDDDLTELYPMLAQADGLVLATPNYWANMSGAMKSFIDRLTALENDGFQLQGKVAAFIAASKENEGGTEMAVMSMVTAMLQMGVLIPPNAALWYPGSWGTAQGKRQRFWAETDAPRVGRAMVKVIERLRGVRW